MLYFLLGISSILYFDLLRKNNLSNEEEIFYQKNYKDFVIIDKIINI
jgi:hypothetical protein